MYVPADGFKSFCCLFAIEFFRLLWLIFRLILRLQNDFQFEYVWMIIIVIIIIELILVLIVTTGNDIIFQCIFCATEWLYLWMHSEIF